MSLLSIAKRFRKDNPRWVILMIDIGIVFFCYYFSNFIINSFKGRFDYELMFCKSITVGLVYFLSFYYFKTYRGIVRQAGIQDARKIMLATFSALGVLMLISFVTRQIFPPDNLPGQFLRQSYAVLFMHAFFTTVALVSARIFYRTIYETLFFHGRKLIRVMIVGAGNMGNITLNLLRNDTKQKYRVVAFADDNSSRVGKFINGYIIIDLFSLNESSIKAMGVEEIIIAIDDNDKQRLNEITEMIESLPVKLKIMPTTAKLLSGQVAARQLRTLKIEDLLGRAAIKLDNPSIKQEFKHKVIMVTGGAGSIGAELVRQIAFTDFSRLIVLDQAESGLYDVQQELSQLCRDNSRFIVGNVRDESFMRDVFEKYRPQIIFHAAAYKHVPLMEDNPYEAVYTNVYGTRVVANLAHEFAAEKFVMVSTDKAVNPTNVMGATKRIAEMYVSAVNQSSRTSYIVTRFGNVLGSNGSVIPLFERQLKKGGPLTVTDPEITRYFMTIPEACQLVQEAATMGKGGEIFVFDMGKPVRIMDLAVRMIRLKGFRYPEDVQIEYTGLRPGEKIYEELLADNENTIKTHHEKIMIAKVDVGQTDEKKVKIEELCVFVKDTSPDKAQVAIVTRLKAIVPEYISHNSKFEMLDGSHVTTQVS